VQLLLRILFPLQLETCAGCLSRFPLSQSAQTHPRNQPSLRKNIL
jgi:hypothetical protein